MRQKTQSIRIKRNQGVALITAVLITSLVSIAAVAMISEQHLQIRRTQNLMHFDQAYAYVLGAEAWAINALKADTGETDSYIDMNDVIGKPISEEVKEKTLDIGGISGIVTDAQAAFPLNNLADTNTDNVNNYKRVLEYLINNGVMEFNPEFHNLVVDWVDANSDVSPGGAEDLDYLSLSGRDRPYRAANQPMASVSELRLLFALSDDAANAKNDYAALVRPGFDPLTAIPPEALLEGSIEKAFEVVEQQPLVNALPPGAKININTAPTVILQSLVQFVDADIADDVVKTIDDERKQQPIKEAKKFTDEIKNEWDAQNRNSSSNQNQQERAQLEQEIQQKIDAVLAMIDVKSEYFYLHAMAQIGDTSVQIISLLERKEDKVKVIRRGIGVI
ncbi:type II secretion system minor pseudopilin GspK [Kaarinaea lacus]